MSPRGKVIGATVLLSLFAIAGAWRYLIRDRDPQDILQYHFECAAYEGNVPEVKRLFDKGAQPNYISQREDVAGGLTALYQAAGNGQDEVIRFLIEHGANVNRGSFGGLQGTPLNIAVEHQHCSTAELLLNSGADIDDVTDDNHEIDPKKWKYGQRLLDLLEKHGAKIKEH